MENVTEFFKSVLNQFGGANFALLAIIDLSAFGAVALAALLGCVFSKRWRAHDKRMFMWLVNAFTAVTLAVFLCEFTLAKSVAAAVAVWLAGYVVYGVLSLVKVKNKKNDSSQMPANVSVMPARPRQVQPAQASPQVAATSGVRLDHALSIADKLLMKNLGRGDRQELEKMKTALTVLKVKGVLSPQEGEALNDMFNALLKLMAKYDL
ncbi:MAG: hypothetical protein NC033_02645 [Clostridiales bacterium]|nr:hypothetical protein [Clostridiales bacterium]